jgi:hypothetical protein
VPVNAGFQPAFDRKRDCNNAQLVCGRRAAPRRTIRLEHAPLQRYPSPTSVASGLPRYLASLRSFIPKEVLRMKQWISALAVFVGTAMLAATVYAAGDTSSPGTGGTTGTGSSGSHATGAMSTGGEMGRHSMEGEVTKVDPKKGHMTLKTAEGNLNLHFPPSALENVKKGDHVTVDLGLRTSGSASTGTSGSAASPKTDTGKSKY